MQPESRYINLVHKHLVGRIHKQAMRSMFHNGTPDRYYEGQRGLLWVEYKWRKAVPRKPFTPALSTLQRRWANRAWYNGVPIAVIVGCPLGGFIFTEGAWNDSDLPPRYSAEQIAQFIQRKVSYEQDEE